MKQFPTAANYIEKEIEKKKMKKSWVLEERLIDSEKRIDKNGEENGTSFFSFSCYFLCLFPRASRANRFTTEEHRTSTTGAAVAALPQFN